MNDTSNPSENAAAPQSFEAFFASEIAPGLPALEAQRRDRLRKTWVRSLGVTFVAVIAGLIGWLAWHPLAGGGLFALLAFAGIFWVQQPAARQRQAVRDLVIPPLCRFLGGDGDSVTYRRKPGHKGSGHKEPGGRFDLEGFRRSGVLPGFKRSKVELEDLIAGRHRATDYQMVEARLKQSGKNSTTTVFAGLLLRIGVPQPFDGNVVIAAAGGRLGNAVADFLRGSFARLQQVPLGHAAFEQRFRVYSDDAATARALLQPGLLDSLLAISDGLGGKPLHCAFFAGEFLMAIPRDGNLFEIGRLTRSLDHAEADIRRLAGEFTIPQRLIDNLHGERVAVLGEGWE